MKTSIEIGEDIKKIGQTLQEEIFSAPEILRQRADELESPFILSLLLLTSAGFDRHDFDHLGPLAVGLELLEFGVKRHYQGNYRGKLPGRAIDDLSLISGDYYYSKGISFAARLGKSDFVKIMAQAIVEVTEAQIGLDCIETYAEEDFFEKYGASLSKRAVLYRAACKLGTIAGVRDERVSASLEVFGGLVGFLRILFENNSWAIRDCGSYEQKTRSLAEEAGEIIKGLSENEDRRFLFDLVEEMI